MSRQDFIALGDMLRLLRPADVMDNGSTYYYFFLGAKKQWEMMRDGLAQYCADGRGTFDKERWLRYVNHREDGISDDQA